MSNFPFIFPNGRYYLMTYERIWVKVTVVEVSLCLRCFLFIHLSSCSSAGHFTQVIWKGSTECGFGFARQGNRGFVVGSYRPAGNMMGDYASNVLPPKNGKIEVPEEKSELFIYPTFSISQFRIYSLYVVFSTTF